jgi:ABC-type antimicrobial peptide transport system permease subunit
LPVREVATQRERIESEYLGQERMFARASTLVGGLALAVTMIGVFGLMSYAVARRAKDVGVRMALGAGRARVLTAVLREALGLVAAGLLAGAGAALAIGRALESQVFGLSGYDGGSLAMASSLIVIASAAAAYLPAARAAAVNPVAVLRSE